MIFFMESGAEFREWLNSHRDGYVMGCDRWPKVMSDMRLHKANCPETSKMQAEMYNKACSMDLEQLVKWATEMVGTNL